MVKPKAGHKNVIGCDMQDLADMIALVEDKSRVGVCLDTCERSDDSPRKASARLTMHIHRSYVFRRVRSPDQGGIHVSGKPLTREAC